MVTNWRTQLTAFHLKNHQADRKCHLEWYEARPYTLTCLPWHHTRPLTHQPKTLPRDARKTILQKQPPQKAAWYELGRVHHTMRTTATALCLSVAEYCCPVWARSTHRKLVDPTLNETCRLITGCIRPTATPDIYVTSLRAVRHRPTRNTAQRSLPERAHQTTDRPATQPPSPPARENPLTLAQ